MSDTNKYLEYFVRLEDAFLNILKRTQDFHVDTLTSFKELASSIPAFDPKHFSVGSANPVDATVNQEPVSKKQPVAVAAKHVPSKSKRLPNPTKNAKHRAKASKH